MGKRPNILIVEDEQGHAALLAAELDRQGVLFASVNVERLDSFLRVLENEPVDLILAEHTATSEKAFAALEAAREQRPEIPFVIVTSSCDPGLLVEIFECGAAGYVRRQQPEELAQIVLKALESAKQLDPLTEVEVIREVPAGDDQSAEPKTDLQERPHLVCPRCKRIADSLGHWERLETYLRLHRQATIALETCPDCTQREHSFGNHELTSNRQSCRGGGVKRIP